MLTYLITLTASAS